MGKISARTTLFFVFEKFTKTFWWFLWRCLNISNKELQINGEITDKEVRLIGSEGEQLGIVPISKAREVALNANLDLVKVADKAVPPVCKIMDYGKYKFEMAKRDKESKKNQRIAEIKEVRLSVNIDTHDFNTKVNHARKFLSNGDRVKISIRFRGREMGHPEIGYDLMSRFAQSCEDVANLDKPAKLEGKCMLMFLSSKPQSTKSSSNAKKQKDGVISESSQQTSTGTTPQEIQSVPSDTISQEAQSASTEVASENI